MCSLKIRTFENPHINNNLGPYWDWKNGKVFSSQGKVGEFYSEYWNNKEFNRLKVFGKMTVFISYLSQIFFALATLGIPIFIVYRIGRLSGGVHQIPGFHAPLFLPACANGHCLRGCNCNPNSVDARYF